MLEPTRLHTLEKMLLLRSLFKDKLEKIVTACAEHADPVEDIVLSAANSTIVDIEDDIEKLVAHHELQMEPEQRIYTNNTDLAGQARKYADHIMGLYDYIYGLYTQGYINEPREIIRNNNAMEINVRYAAMEKWYRMLLDVYGKNHAVTPAPPPRPAQEIKKVIEGVNRLLKHFNLEEV